MAAMAATAITISRSVARMGDMAFLVFNRFLPFNFHPFRCLGKSGDFLFNMYELEIHIQNKSEIIAIALATFLVAISFSLWC
jgi:hypothetical protein